MAEKALFLTFAGQENFGQGFHPVRRREAPRARDSRILVLAFLILPHSGEILSLLLLHDRPPGLASEGQTLKFWSTIRHVPH